jgi:hypothetical protein
MGRSSCWRGIHKTDFFTANSAEFEQKSDAVEAGGNATVRFFARNEEESSTGLLGEGTKTPSLSQTPSLLGESTR